jgi:putative transposase
MPCAPGATACDSSTRNKLRVPENLSLVFLPPYSPELNSIERLWLLSGSE